MNRRERGREETTDTHMHTHADDARNRDNEGNVLVFNCL